MIIRYSATGRRNSGSNVSSTAAMMTPMVLPMPPRMTMTTKVMDCIKPNPPGGRNCFECAFFAGIAGGLYAHSKQFLTPGGFGFMQSITFVVMVILGGMGNTIGVIIAAVLLTLLPEFLRPVAEYRMII